MSQIGMASIPYLALYSLSFGRYTVPSLITSCLSSPLTSSNRASVLEYSALSSAGASTRSSPHVNTVSGITLSFVSTFVGFLSNSLSTCELSPTTVHVDMATNLYVMLGSCSKPNLHPIAHALELLRFE